MEIKNLELYLENRSIIEENEKLRHKALLLHQENSALLSQLLQRGGSSHPPTSAGDKKPHPLENWFMDHDIQRA
ncbi:hypothetical protein RJ640_024024 [Escallonia rubra]|uniref:Uncharacterized protein n=1 Tax=Escallonia rubra TaxID=112253 RepID=A0AA88S8W5_9ASTE|nr:hypothetical protein RJ640_024024 [Escallonia rubra]